VRIERLSGDVAAATKRSLAAGPSEPRPGGPASEAAFIVRAAMNVRGLAVSRDHLAVWNGGACQVFRLGAAEGEQVSVHQTAARSMAFHGDSLFRAVGAEVQQCTLQGRVVTKVPFSEAEGKPLLLDVNGAFLAVATSSGLIKVFDLTKQADGPGSATASMEKAASGRGGSSDGAATAAAAAAAAAGLGAGPRQVGSAGHFVDGATGLSLGVVRGIAVNCAGEAHNTWRV